MNADGSRRPPGDGAVVAALYERRAVGSRFGALFALVAVTGLLALPIGAFAQDKPASPPPAKPPVDSPNSNLESARQKAIRHKLDTIIIDKVKFDKLDIVLIIQFLQAKSKELDPDHEGVHFIFRLSPDPPSLPIHREVSLQLENVSLSQFLDYYIPVETNLQFTVEDDAIYLRPLGRDSKILWPRTFLVPPGFFNIKTPPPMESGDTIGLDRVDVKKQLTDLGFHFSDYATAVYLPNSSKLVVRDTPEQLELIATYVEKLNASKPQPPGTTVPPAKPVDQSTALVPRTFLVPPGFLNIKTPPPTDDEIYSRGFTDIRVEKQLTDLGFLFPEGATAFFLPDANKLVVRNTSEQLGLIAKYIEKLSPPKPLVDDPVTLTPRTFLVPPGFLNIKTPPASDTTTSNMTTVVIPVQKQLTDLGFLFPDGATAVLLPESMKLVVRDTPDQLDLIAKYIEKLNASKPDPGGQEKAARLPSEEPPVDANPPDPRQQAIRHKLDSIIIDKVNFDKLDVAVAIEFLQKRSKQLDPDHEGVNFVLRLTLNAPPPSAAVPASGAAPAPAPAPTAPSIHREVSITLENVSLRDLLSAICAQTNLDCRVEDYAIYFRPIGDESETMRVRIFPVPANFFKSGNPK